MIWGAICGDQKSPLIVVQRNLTAQRYIDQIQRPVLLPFLHHRGQQGLIFQHDNARPHVARLVQDFPQASAVTVKPWPARSPDLSPMEHVWDHLDRQVRQWNHQPATRLQLLQNQKPVDDAWPLPPREESTPVRRPDEVKLAIDTLWVMNIFLNTNDIAECEFRIFYSMVINVLKKLITVQG